VANNRLQLKCVCGAERFLAKRFGDGYYVPELEGGDAQYVERLNQFLTEHAWCEGNQDHFTISYEISPDSDK
jgi:hypothetical protein